MQALIARLANFLRRRDLHLAGARSGELNYWPKPLPDLYFGEPLMVAIKLDSQAARYPH